MHLFQIILYCIAQYVSLQRIVSQLFLCYKRQRWRCQFARITQPYRFAKTPLYNGRLPFITAHDGNCRFFRRNCSYAWSPEIVKINFKRRLRKNESAHKKKDCALIDAVCLQQTYDIKSLT